MIRRALALSVALVLAAVAAAWTTPAAPVGPPWISIEVPPNPFDRASRDAFLLVHAFHHGTPVSFPVTGRAEGIVDGTRRSQPLQLTRTSRDGVYALRQQWPTAGDWILVLTVHQASNAAATAIVDLGPDGRVASVHVPARRHDGWMIPQPVSDEEIAARLASRVAANGAMRQVTARASSGY